MCYTAAAAVEWSMEMLSESKKLDALWQDWQWCNGTGQGSFCE
jgi:hypothetical protein